MASTDLKVSELVINELKPEKTELNWKYPSLCVTIYIQTIYLKHAKRRNIMSYLSAIFLGIVQGVSEFLPISSSGHLVLVQNLLKVEGGMLLFDTLLHVGSLAAVLVVLWPDIRQMLKKAAEKFGE